MYLLSVSCRRSVRRGLAVVYTPSTPSSVVMQLGASHGQLLQAWRGTVVQWCRRRPWERRMLSAPVQDVVSPSSSCMLQARPQPAPVGRVMAQSPSCITPPALCLVGPLRCLDGSCVPSGALSARRVPAHVRLRMRWRRADHLEAGRSSTCACKSTSRRTLLVPQCAQFSGR